MLCYWRHVSRPHRKTKIAWKNIKNNWPAWHKIVQGCLKWQDSRLTIVKILWMDVVPCPPAPLGGCVKPSCPKCKIGWHRLGLPPPESTHLNPNIADHWLLNYYGQEWESHLLWFRPLWYVLFLFCERLTRFIKTSFIFMDRSYVMCNKVYTKSWEAAMAAACRLHG